MQPKNSIAGPNALFDAASGIEAIDFGRPSVAGFNPRNELLADSKFSGNLFLHRSRFQPAQDAPVSGVQFIHSSALSGDDRQRSVSFLSLDREIGASDEQKPLNVRRTGNSVAVKPPMMRLGTPILFNPSKSKSSGHSIQGWSVRVRQSQANTAFGLVNFDAAFAVKEACQVACKGVIAEVFHSSLSRFRALLASMAVPVVRWIGERIRLFAQQAQERAP